VTEQRVPLRTLLDAATARLRDAGVESPAYDAAELLAHALGTTRSRLPLVEAVEEATRDRFEELVERRAGREPLQHLTGSAAFRHVDLAVGPGVFVPRPETELLAGWAIATALRAEQENRTCRVVDLCTGSGAIALAVATEVPTADVHAVEMESRAVAWAERNLSGTAVDLRQGDMADAFPDLDGTVDVVVCNPPYIPHDAWESVAPEARDHDPQAALFSTGDDGLDAMRVVEQVAGRLLRPGGWVGVEHADLQGETAPQVFAATGRWADVRDHEDLAGRPRYVTARLAR
jgi:release factor glutamine methyltransferase